MSKDRIKKIINLFGKLLLVLSVIFIAVKIRNLGFDASSIDDVPGFICVFLMALILNMGSTIIMALVWGRWISFFSFSKVDKAKVISIYGKSSIGKYLPGNVMHYVERNLFAAEYGLSQKKIAFSSIMEIAGQVLSAFIISLIMLPKAFFRKVLETIQGSLLSVAILGGICLIIGLLVVGFIVVKKINIGEILKGYKISDFACTIVLALVGGVVFLLMNGLGMLTLCMYCLHTSLDIESARAILSSYSAAWVCGFVIPGAPGGIGVREALLSVLLGDIIGSSLMFIIIVHRLITIVGDFLIYVLSKLIERRIKSSTD